MRSRTDELIHIWNAVDIDYLLYNFSYEESSIKEHARTDCIMPTRNNEAVNYNNEDYTDEIA